MIGEHREMERLRLQRSKLAEFGSFAFTSSNLDDILTEACKTAADGLDQPDIKVKVLEHRPQSGDFLLRAGINWPAGVVGNATVGADLDSPAGYAFASNGPVVSQDLRSEERFRTPPLLEEVGVVCMVNVIISGRDAHYGIFEADGTSPAMFDEEDIDFLKSMANLLAAAIERMHLREVRESHLREQEVLVKELGHRAKNLFALIQAIANQVRTVGASAEEFKESFVGRLQALARAENLMFEAGYETLDLRDVAAAILEPYMNQASEVVTFDGPQVMVPARSGRMLGLVLHELATNASKHGALSTPKGSVRLHWQISDTDGAVVLRWTEHGGPPYETPERRGFGTRLLETICPAELGGDAQLQPHFEGMIYQLRFPGPN